MSSKRGYWIAGFASAGAIPSGLAFGIRLILADAPLASRPNVPVMQE
ncbi:MAG: hypothetical protein KAS81_02140 [Anaerolineales bacterium]|nr:hypothetical protein [Anaerolineales bacterium]